MTLEGAINLNETNDYVVYTMNSVTTGQYGVILPKNINGTLNMLVDLHMKGSFDGVGNGSKTKEQLVSEVTDEYNELKTRYVDGMLVMPMIDEAVFQSTVLNGDKQKMFDEVKKIGAITSELYKKLTDQGVDKQKIDQKIIIVEKSQEDEKFVAWLKEQMPNFVDGINYSELSQVQEVVNPFANNNIFGTAQEEASKVEESVVSAPVSGGGIFDNVAPVAPSASVEPVTPIVEVPVVPEVSAAPVVEPVAPSALVEPVAPVVETPVVEPVVPSTPVEPVNSTPSVNPDLFATPTNVQNAEVVSAPVENTVIQNTVVPAVPVAQSGQSVVEGPKPVESAMLEGTIAFTPIPNHPNNPTENVAVTNEEVGEERKKSKGFANLIIIVGVLFAVTIASIELGKYLYSVYGA